MGEASEKGGRGKERLGMIGSGYRKDRQKKEKKVGV